MDHVVARQVQGARPAHRARHLRDHPARRRQEGRLEAGGRGRGAGRRLVGLRRLPGADAADLRVRGLRAGGDDHRRGQLHRRAHRLLRAQGPAARHGHQPHRAVDVLPDVPAVRGPDVPRGQGPRARARVREGLQRLDDRRMVRRLRRPPHPARDHPALGRRPRGRRDPQERGARLPCGRVHRAPGLPRPAHGPRQEPLLGPVLPGLRRDRHRDLHAHRFRLPPSQHQRRRPQRRDARPHVAQRVHGHGPTGCCVARWPGSPS